MIVTEDNRVEHFDSATFLSYWLGAVDLQYMKLSYAKRSVEHGIRRTYEASWEKWFPALYFQMSCC